MYRGNCKNVEDGNDTGEEGSQPMPVDDDNDLSAPEANDGGSGANEQQLDPVGDTWHAAVFILSIKEQHMLTQAAVDRVISSTSTLISRLNRGIVQDLEQAYSGVVPDSIMSEITSRVQCTESIFSGISTAYEQKKFFKETFNVVVSVIIIMHVVCMHNVFFACQLSGTNINHSWTARDFKARKKATFSSKS